MNELINDASEFVFRGFGTGITLCDFWSWAYSDLLNNASRGVLAEFLVFSSFGSIKNFRFDWMPYDLLSPSGRRIEVKSSAFLQSWTEDRFSDILFDIAPKHTWSAEAGYSVEKKRKSDLYVFCVYTSLSKDKSPLNLDLWNFYVLPTSVLNKKNPEQKKISLNSLLKLNPVKADFSSLAQSIESLFQGGNNATT